MSLQYLFWHFNFFLAPLPFGLIEILKHLLSLLDRAVVHVRTANSSSCLR